MKKTAKIVVALLLAMVMVLTVFAAVACDKDDLCKDGHKLKAVERKEATTEAAGYEAYWECENCHKLFSDSEGKNEIQKPVELPKLTGSTPGLGSDDMFETISAPAAGEYVFSMIQGGKRYYASSLELDGNYIATSTDANLAVKFTVENATDGWYIKMGTKYLEINPYENTKNNKTSYSLKLVDTPNTVWTWRADEMVFQQEATQIVESNPATNNFYIGTYDGSSFTTMSPSDVSFITGDNASKLDVSQHPARFGKIVGTVTPTHVCNHVCPEPGCGKCLDETCTDPACADKCSGHEAVIIPENATHVTLNIQTIGEANSWENNSQHESLPTGDANLMIAATGTPVGSYSLNTGKYNNNKTWTWRIYQNENPELKISVSTGYKLVAIKITYNVSNTGILTVGGANLASGTLYGVKDAETSQCIFSCGQTADKNNGQVQITDIEVWYIAE